MKIKFIKCIFEDLGRYIQAYMSSLSSPIDSFLEGHIIDSDFFMIYVDGKKAGYFAVQKKERLTQFYMLDKYKKYGQNVYIEMKRVLNVRSAFVPTCDEFFLAHAVDSYKTLDKQAYFFCDSKKKVKGDHDIVLRKAVYTDIGSIKENSGDFFGELEREVNDGIIYIAEKDSMTVGYGVIEKQKIMKNYASIGMFTIENLRQQGIGKSIIIGLKEMTYEMGLKPLAGCWYYNHNSKKTLESAGMITKTRLLKFGF